jgi:hypothetical protein
MLADLSMASLMLAWALAFAGFVWLCRRLAR